MNTKHVSAVLFLIPILLTSNAALAAGFEKALMWSGRYAGTAGAAVGSVAGAEALYFNPAGLAAGWGGHLSVNLSPTLAKFEGPLSTASGQQSTGWHFSLPGGILASYGLTEQLAFGLGYYASGGTKAIFDNADIGVPGFNPNVRADLAVEELALGLGYEVLPHFRLGIAYRVVFVHASLGTVVPLSAASLVGVQVDDISATRWNGFKIGAQYSNDDDTWGLGMAWRTPVAFSASGTSSGTQAIITSPTAAPTVAPITGGSATVGSTFPSQVQIGGYFEPLPKNLRLLAEYDWTEYHANQQLDLGGTVTLAAPAVPVPLSSIPLGWRNMYNLRFGVEDWGLGSCQLRLGYIFTSQVVPESSARATFSSPGAGHTFTLGAGTQMLDRKLDLNAALEYSFASGTVTADQAATGNSVPGDYSTKAMVLHLGAAYRF